MRLMIDTLIRRQLHSMDLAYKALGSVLDIAKVLTVTNDDVLNAYIQRASDFEDCLLATCAKANQCDAIVTRNKKDFLAFENRPSLTGGTAGRVLIIFLGMWH